MEINNDKEMEINGMYLSKEKEMNEIELSNLFPYKKKVTLFRCFKIKE